MPLRLEAAVARAAGAALLSATMLALASCSTSPTRPGGTPAQVFRMVTVVVRDSLDAPVADSPTQWTSPAGSDGGRTIMFARTGADGRIGRILWSGDWIVTAGTFPLVAGATFAVAGEERAENDTQLVNLVARTASSVSGSLATPALANLSAATVTGPFAALTGARPDGTWRLAGVPVGRWTLTVLLTGCYPGTVTVTVPSPGSTVHVPPVRLSPRRIP